MENIIPLNIKNTELIDFFLAHRQNLQDADWIANAIAPHCKHRPKVKTAGGLSIVQDSKEFAVWLVVLSQNEVKSYTEIGCWAGGSLYIADSYLRSSVAGYSGCTGIDITMKRMIDFDAYQSKHKTVRFIQRDSKRVRIKIETDAAFIDGDHSKDGMLADFAMCRSVKKVVGCHDMASAMGCSEAWETISKSRNTESIITKMKTPRRQKGIGVVYMQSK